MRPEVIYAGRKPWQVATDQVEVDVIESAGTGRRAEVDFPARIRAAFGNTGGEKQYCGQGRDIGNACPSLFDPGS